VTPEKRLQHAASKLAIAARMTREAQADVRLALKQIAQRKADQKAEHAA
jgi:hypothetical protein